MLLLNKASLYIFSAERLCDGEDIIVSLLSSFVLSLPVAAFCVPVSTDGMVDSWCLISVSSEISVAFSVVTGCISVSGISDISSVISLSETVISSTAVSSVTAPVSLVTVVFTVLVAVMELLVLICV